MGDGVAFATGSFGVWEAGLGRLLTPICGLSRPSAVSLRSAVPLRRMDYALHLTFINTQPHLPCFLSAASPQGVDMRGSGGYAPRY